MAPLSSQPPMGAIPPNHAGKSILLGRMDPTCPHGEAPKASAGVELARIVHGFRRGGIMPSLTIRHVTTYRYRQPVAFGEHRMMFRPRDSHDQRVLGASLEISPEPRSLSFVQDPFGNHVGIARFSGRSKKLCFESIVCLEHSPLDAADLHFEDAARIFPVAYSADEMPDLAHCIERHQPDPGNAVGRWARQFLPQTGSIGTFELLLRLSQGIRRDFDYRRREAKGIQQPAETLRLGHGSCRDFALLMIEAARSLGFAARFASGYLAVPLAVPLDGPEPQASSPRGSTHAWAQIYLPGTGWIDFDPTSGSVGKIGLVTVAVVRDPHHAIPLHGTFIGLASDHLGMEVEVSVTPGSPETIFAGPRRSTRAKLVETA
ncbi:MAG: transglutaminase N-terminal domain-containing protein [Hyphomicrobiales bacterium]